MKSNVLSVNGSGQSIALRPSPNLVMVSRRPDTHSLPQDNVSLASLDPNQRCFRVSSDGGCEGAIKVLPSKGEDDRYSSAATVRANSSELLPQLKAEQGGSLKYQPVSQIRNVWGEVLDRMYTHKKADQWLVSTFPAPKVSVRINHPIDWCSRSSGIIWQKSAIGPTVCPLSAVLALEPTWNGDPSTFWYLPNVERAGVMTKIRQRQ